MLNKLKCIVSIILSIVVLLTYILPASAAGILIEKPYIEEVLTNKALASYTIEQLYELSHEVESQNNANAVFEELLKRVSKKENQSIIENEGGYPSKASGNTVLIDNYISVTSTSLTTSHVLTIVVNVKSKIPAIAYLNFRLGYEYPSACRTGGTLVNMAGINKGTHTIRINTKGLVSGISVVASVIARDYKEGKCFKKLFDRPYANHIAYQTITQTDVTLHKVTAAIPSVVLFFLPNANNMNKLAKATIKIVEGLSIVASLNVLTPDLAVGQYYKTTTTYTTDFKCVVKVEIYASQASYKAGSKPIHTSNSSINIPH